MARNLCVVDVVVERTVRLGSIEFDVESVPEWPERVTILGIARFRHRTFPEAVTEGNALLLRPYFVGQRFHEFLHGDDAVIFRDNGDIEVMRKWDLVRPGLSFMVLHPGRQDQGAVEAFRKGNGAEVMISLISKSS